MPLLPKSLFLCGNGAKMMVSSIRHSRRNRPINLCNEQPPCSFSKKSIISRKISPRFSYLMESTKTKGTLLSFILTPLKKKPQLTRAKSDDSSLIFKYLQKCTFWCENPMDRMEYIRIQSLTTLIPKTHIIPHSYRSNKSRHE